MMPKSKVAVGGWSPVLPDPPLPASAEIQDLVNQVLPELQKKLSMNFSVAQALNVCSQVVAGFNYLILVIMHDIA